MIDIILWVGLPGSGKTYNANKHCDFVVDDISHISQLPNSEELGENVLGITDVNFCDKKILNKAITKLSEIYENVFIEIRYFENDAKKCRDNVRYRADGRNVEGTILRFENIYDPWPPTAMKIWTDQESN